MNSAAGVMILVGLVFMVVGLAFMIVSFRFLTAGRRAFDRYLDMTEDPIGRAAPVPPVAPSGEGTTAPPGHRRPPASWGSR